MMNNMTVFTQATSLGCRSGMYSSRSDFGSDKRRPSELSVPSCRQ